LIEGLLRCYHIKQNLLFDALDYLIEKYIQLL